MSNLYLFSKIPSNGKLCLFEFQDQEALAFVLQNCEAWLVSGEFEKEPDCILGTELGRTFYVNEDAPLVLTPLPKGTTEMILPQCGPYLTKINGILEERIPSMQFFAGAEARAYQWHLAKRCPEAGLAELLSFDDELPMLLLILLQEARIKFDPEEGSEITERAFIILQEKRPL